MHTCHNGILHYSDLLEDTNHELQGKHTSSDPGLKQFAGRLPDVTLPKRDFQMRASLVQLHIAR